jgi:hypothetical protein
VLRMCSVRWKHVAFINEPHMWMILPFAKALLMAL